MIILNKETSNGVVYNAKGDINGGEWISISTNNVAPAVASVTFNVDGTITYGGNGVQSGPSTWLDTTWGTEDSPLWPDPTPDPLDRDWQGISNYGMIDIVHTGSGGPTGTTASFPVTFTVSDSTGGASGIWNGKIVNTGRSVGDPLREKGFGVDLQANGACFEGNTPVLMADNTQKLIKDVVVGDVLASYAVPNRIDVSDPSWTTWSSSTLTGGSITTSTVMSTTPVDVSSYYVLNGNLKVTPTHTMLVFKQSTSTWQWMDVQDITIGDLMYDNTENTIAITSMTTATDNITVYDLNLETVDTFYVNMNGNLVAVHNAS